MLLEGRKEVTSAALHFHSCRERPGTEASSALALEMLPGVPNYAMLGVPLPGVQALVRRVVFPVGLSLSVLSKSELVTANFLSQALPAPSVDALRVLSVSFAANLAGSLAMVGAASVAGVFTPGAAAMLVKARDRCRIQKPRRLLIVGSMVASPPRSRRPK